MKRSIVAAVISGLAIVGLSVQTLAQDGETSGYLPQEGDSVVVYTHTFRPEFFEEAAQLVAEGFTQAMDEMGQTRHTIFIKNPSTYEVIAISFFAEGENVEDWHAYAGRIDVLERLEEMRQEPMRVKQYEVDAITSTE